MKKQIRLPFVFLLVIICTIFAWGAMSVVAWQSSIIYGHTNRFGGEAESGYHRGQVEFSGNKRYVRAGDDYVYWTSNQIGWIIANGSSDKRPALVYHAFAPNTNHCNAIRATSWSWSNLPGWQPYNKGCGATGNEVRFLIYSYYSLSAGTKYYFQHLFEDTDYPNHYTHGEITTDSYWDVGWYHWGQYKDYHTKFCVGDSLTFNPSSGNCPQ